MLPWIPDLTNPQEFFIRAAINAACAKALKDRTDPIAQSAAQYHAAEAVYFTARGLKALAIKCAVEPTDTKTARPES